MPADPKLATAGGHGYREIRISRRVDLRGIERDVAGSGKRADERARRETRNAGETQIGGRVDSRIADALQAHVAEQVDEACVHRERRASADCRLRALALRQRNAAAEGDRIPRQPDGICPGQRLNIRCLQLEPVGNGQRTIRAETDGVVGLQGQAVESAGRDQCRIETHGAVCTSRSWRR